MSGAVLAGTASWLPSALPGAHLDLAMFASPLASFVAADGCRAESQYLPYGRCQLNPSESDCAERRPDCPNRPEATPWCPRTMNEWLT